jgi:hypothetical protein
MSVAEFCQTVRSRWQAFTRLLWPETARGRLDAEIRCRDDELRRRYEALLRRRRHIERLRGRLDKDQRRAAALDVEVQRCVAAGEPDKGYPPALALYQLRQRIERRQRRLAGHERKYRRQRAAFDRRKRQRQELQRQRRAV